jgi:S-DNA-T family DNA segregation ATPase FtsK/SpoIIIE
MLLRRAAISSVFSVLSSTTHEVERITEFIGSQRGYPTAYSLPEFNEEDAQPVEEMDPNERDELFEDAAYIIVAAQQGSHRCYSES